MKVAFFAHYSRMYGANQSLLTLVTGLREYGVDPVVFVPTQGEFVGKIRRLKIPYEIVPYSYWMAPKRTRFLAPLRIVRNLIAVRILSEHARKWNVDLLHTNSTVIGIGAMVSQRTNLPHVWHLREFAELTFGMQYDLGRNRSRRIMATSSAFIAVSESLRSSLLSSRDIERCEVIYNGVLAAEEMVRFRRKLWNRPRNREFTFVMVGSISPNKGQEVAIRAIELVARRYRVRLLIAGTGGHRYVQRLKRLCQSLHVSDIVIFTGFVRDPFSVYLNADASIVASEYEGMGRSTAEAMSIGLPVIGRHSTGTAELIDHESNGLLYDGDVEQLAACMSKLIADKDIRRRLSKAAWKKACRQFTIEQYCEKVHQVFDSTLANHRR